MDLATLTGNSDRVSFFDGELSRREKPRRVSRGERGQKRSKSDLTTDIYSSRRITCSTASAMGKAAVSTTALTANAKTRVTVRIRFSLVLSFRFFEGPGDTEIVANLIHLGCQEIIIWTGLPTHRTTRLSSTTSMLKLGRRRCGFRNLENISYPALSEKSRTSFCRSKPGFSAT